MIPEEAIWIRQLIDQLRPASILNCGSGSLHYRTVEQPYISSVLFQGLHNVTHLDLRPMEGVDRVADLCSEDFPLDDRFELVICTSVLEHVIDVDAAMRNLADVSGRHLVVSAPCEWPYHPDPIDTLYRPTLEELGQLIAVHRFVIMASELLRDARSKGLLAVVHAERREGSCNRR